MARLGQMDDSGGDDSVCEPNPDNLATARGILTWVLVAISIWVAVGMLLVSRQAGSMSTQLALDKKSASEVRDERASAFPD